MRKRDHLCIAHFCRDCNMCRICAIGHEEAHAAHIAAQAVDAAYRLQSGKAVKKRQSTPFVQMGANGTKPVVTRSSENWYKHRESGEVEIRHIEPKPAKSAKPRKRRNSYETW